MRQLSTSIRARKSVIQPPNWNFLLARFLYAEANNNPADALNNQTKGFTRAPVVHEEGRAVGFYGVAPTAIPASVLSRSVRTWRPPDPVPCILLGQFAVDKHFMGRGIGSALLKEALTRCVAAVDAIGGRAVIVRAIDKDAETYWRSCGFISAKDDPSTLFQSIENVAKWLKPKPPKA